MIPEFPESSPKSLAVADFNKDGNADLIVASNTTSGKVYLSLGNGNGTFQDPQAYAVGPDPVALAVADFNGDGYPDVVTVSSSPTTTKNISVLLNNVGFGFQAAVYTSLGASGGNPLEGVAIVHLNQDAFPDLVVTGASYQVVAGTEVHQNNIQLLTGLGAGEFTLTSQPFSAGGSNMQLLPGSTVTTVQDPFHSILTFTITSHYVGPNLLANGGFEEADLATEKGNLDGWNTYDQPDPNGGSSKGAWSIQTGDSSPASDTNVSGPTLGEYQAMLDEESEIPILSNTSSLNTEASYAGSHALFQAVTIPANAQYVTLSMDLYLQSFGSWSDPIQNPTLNYTTGVPTSKCALISSTQRILI